MNLCDLPLSLTVGGIERPINSDWRTGMTCMMALQDAELTDTDKGIVVLALVYKEALRSDESGEALTRAMWYLSGGSDTPSKPTPTLVSWEQDARYIVSAVNRVAGREVRADENLHWWTFLSWYQEIGDCMLAQIVRIRNIKARGRKMERDDILWYRENREIVDLKMKISESESETFKKWGV